MTPLHDVSSETKTVGIWAWLTVIMSWQSVSMTERQLESHVSASKFSLKAGGWSWMLISIKAHTYRLPEASAALGWTLLQSLKWMSHVLAHADEISELQSRQMRRHIFSTVGGNLHYGKFIVINGWWYKGIPIALGVWCFQTSNKTKVVLFKRWFSVLTPARLKFDAIKTV